MNRSQDGLHRTALIGLCLATALPVAWVTWRGADFFGTSLGQRPHHPDYRIFRSAGSVGHGLGVFGAGMVLLLLLYSLRKRLRVMRHWGNLRVWLRYHIFLGVSGPILITLHTAFKIDGLVAVSYWSMVAVAVSGVIGRFLYQQIPQNLLGEALTLPEIEERGEAMLVELSTEYGLDQSALASLERLALGRLENRPSGLALLNLPLLNAALARQMQSWATGLPALPSEARRTARLWVVQTRRLYFFHLVRDLFHWWHVFHKPFAVIMVVVMIIHVAVAIALGFTWRF